jgi:FKBP-type peptidyl-prolyl cis-trans isomerase
MRCLTCIVLTGITFACGGGRLTDPDELTNEDFADALSVDLAAMTRTVSGLYWQDLVVGTGTEAVVGALVVVQYDGYLINGTLFDTSRDKSESFDFTLGAGQVIRGWDEGVRGMRVGGVRKLVIPPNLAYGPAGIPGTIPSNATLVFDVELLDVIP